MEDLGQLRDGHLFYASAQLDHECFKLAPSGAQVTTESATVEPASTEPNTRWHEEGENTVLRLIANGGVRAQVHRSSDIGVKKGWFWEHWPWMGHCGWVDTKEEAMRLASCGWVTTENQASQPQPEKEVKEPATQSTGDPAPEPQYRIPEVGEMIQEGDEIKDDSCPTGWRKTGIRCKVIKAKIRRPIDAGQPAPSTPAAKLSESSTLIARVRKAVEADIQQSFTNALTPDRGYDEVPISNTMEVIQPIADLCESRQARIAELEKERNKLLGFYEEIVRYLGHDLALKEIRELRAERDKWKSNHDNQVNLRRTLMDRPDLGDRAKRVQQMAGQLDSERQKREAAEKERDGLMRNPDISTCSKGHHFRTIASHPAKSEREWYCPNCMAAELSTLRAENAELRKDKERLDWVADRACPLRITPSGEAIYGSGPGTFRAAIDSAKAKGEQ